MNRKPRDLRIQRRGLGGRTLPPLRPPEFGLSGLASSTLPDPGEGRSSIREPGGPDSELGSGRRNPDSERGEGKEDTIPIYKGIYSSYSRHPWVPLPSYAKCQKPRLAPLLGRNLITSGCPLSLMSPACHAELQAEGNKAGPAQIHMPSPAPPET